jgi:hypothetical protein
VGVYRVKILENVEQAPSPAFKKQTAEGGCSTFFIFGGGKKLMKAETGAGPS